MNPVSALAEHIEEEIYKGKINADVLQNVINLLSAQIWQKTVKKLRMQTQVENSEKDKSVPELSSVDITKPIYRPCLQPIRCLPSGVKLAKLFLSVRIRGWMLFP